MGNTDKNIEELLTARADILARTNEMNGRYKAAEFGLDFWDEEYLPEPLDRIVKRADLADKLIAEAEAEGRDVDDPIVLKEIASKVNKTMGQSIFRTYWHKLRVSIRKFIKFVTAPDDNQT